MKQYDLIVIGGGSGGLVASKLAVGLGKSVALIEKNKLGGECTNTGCVPSKALIKSAAVAWETQHLNDYGLTGTPTIGTESLMEYIRSVIDEVASTHTPEKLEEAGITVIFGEASFIDANTIQVNDTTLTAKKFIITTGSSPFVPPIEGLDSVDYLTNENFFDLKTLPKSLSIIGGGPIGAEMASALNRLGVDVTIIEMQERMLMHEDKELAELLQGYLTEEGVTILTNTQVTSIAKTGTKNASGVQLTCTSNNDTITVDSEQLLVAVGRKPNIEGLNLDAIGVKTDKRGITVNNKMQTSVSNIYAVGDVVGPYQFSHMAFYQAVVAGRNALMPWHAKTSYDNVVWVTFTAPEIANAGMTEEQARAKYGDRIKIYRKEYQELDRAHTDRATRGMGKFICDPSGTLVGAHIVGERAGEIIHEAQVAKKLGIPFAKLYSVIHAYPTYSELVWHASRKAYLDKIQSNPFVKFFNTITGKKKSS